MREFALHGPGAAGRGAGGAASGTAASGTAASGTTAAAASGTGQRPPRSCERKQHEFDSCCTGWPASAIDQWFPLTTHSGVVKRASFCGTGGDSLGLFFWWPATMDSRSFLRSASDVL